MNQLLYYAPKACQVFNTWLIISYNDHALTTKKKDLKYTYIIDKINK